MAKKPLITAPEAEEIAARAFLFLSGEPQRAQRFLALTGLDAAGVGAQMHQKSFLAGVLDHFLVAIGGQEQDRDIVLGANKPCRINAAHYRHANIQYCQIRWAQMAGSNGFFSRRCRLHVVTVLDQIFGKCCQDNAIIVGK